MPRNAMVVVDMLYDFIDGSLACLHANEAVAEAKRQIEEALSKDKDFPILFILDHHPQNHSSFKEFGGIWPSHCVAGTRGGEIHDDLKPFVKPEFSFYKGCEVDKEQYSGFEGVNDKGESLAKALSGMGVMDVTVVGIATEYCVKETCLDLHKRGFAVTLVSEALAYVDFEGHKKTLEELTQKGITVI